MYTHYSFQTGVADDATYTVFGQVAPIAQASLTYMLRERGGGVSLFYRHSFNAKYEDFGTFGLSIHYYPKNSR